MKKNKNQTPSTRDDGFIGMSIPKTLAKFIIPAALGQLTFLILNLADAFFVGRTGDVYQISAMTITFPVVMLISCVGTVFGVGGNANMAAELGKGKRRWARTFSAFAIYTGAAVIIVISLILLVLKEPLLYLIGADENSVGFCMDYLFWTFHIGCVPQTLTQVFSQLFLAEGRSKISAAGIAGAGIINVILDPIFIFGFNMGIAGAALATCISNYISFAFYVTMRYKNRKTTVVCFNPGYYRAGSGVCAKVLAVGVPAGLVLMFMNICDFVRNYYFNLLGGQVELAAWGVVQKIGNAFIQICIGIAQGVRPVLSFNYSFGLVKRVKSIANGAIIVMASWIFFSLLLVNLFPTLLVNFLIPTGDSVPVAVSYLQVWIYCVVGIGFIELFNSIFQAVGKWKISMVNTIINKGFLLTPVLILMANIFGIEGMVISQPITEDLTAIVLLIIYLIVMKREISALQNKQGNDLKL